MVRLLFVLGLNAVLLNAALALPNRILIITDEKDMRYAHRVKALIKSLPPFSYMNTGVGIKIVSSMTDDCSVASTRILTCNSKVMAQAKKYHKMFEATVTIIAATVEARGGAGSMGNMNEPVLTSTAMEPLGAVHEIMHAMNFSDEYEEAGVSSCTWGYNAKLARKGEVSGCSENGPTTIMKTTISPCIPKSYWPQIAYALGVETPDGRDRCVY